MVEDGTRLGWLICFMLFLYSARFFFSLLFFKRWSAFHRWWVVSSFHSFFHFAQSFDCEFMTTSQPTLGMTFQTILLSQFFDLNILFYTVNVIIFNIVGPLYLFPLKNQFLFDEVNTLLYGTFFEDFVFIAYPLDHTKATNS